MKYYSVSIRDFDFLNKIPWVFFFLKVLPCSVLHYDNVAKCVTILEEPHIKFSYGKLADWMDAAKKGFVIKHQLNPTKFTDHRWDMWT